MIRSFAETATEVVGKFQKSRRLPADIQRTALRKLIHLDAAERLLDLRDPPGMR
jgi:proteic killer suppression protein